MFYNFESCQKNLSAPLGFVSQPLLPNTCRLILFFLGSRGHRALGVEPLPAFLLASCSWILRMMGAHAPPSTHPWCMAFPINIRQNWKKIQRINTLAYLASISMRKRKQFSNPDTWKTAERSSSAALKKKHLEQIFSKNLFVTFPLKKIII